MTMTRSMLFVPGDSARKLEKALAFDSDGSLWVTGQYGGGILLTFTADQQRAHEQAAEAVEVSNG